MGQSLEVVTSELRSASATLADTSQRLQDGLAAVDLSVDQLLGSGWKGGAASAYSEQWDKWHNGAGQVIRGLQSMAESLKLAADSYSTTDQQAAGAVGSSFQPAASTPAAGTVSAPSTAAAQKVAPSTPTTRSMASMMGLGGPLAQQSGDPTAQGGAQLPGIPVGGLAQVAAGIAQGVVGIVQAAQDQTADSADERDEQMDEQMDDESGAAPGSSSGSAPAATPPSVTPEPTMRTRADDAQ
ncbi:WXG100 family type VII secretion target [Mycolicibacterium phlei]|uniref:WXG100 family type VII secretion target n=1 Tax=Mycolicibacterium phlei TaxID=1771 RepID=UPI0037CC746F